MQKTGMLKSLVMVAHSSPAVKSGITSAFYVANVVLTLLIGLGIVGPAISLFGWEVGKNLSTVGGALLVVMYLFMIALAETEETMRKRKLLPPSDDARPTQVAYGLLVKANFSSSKRS